VQLDVGWISHIYLSMTFYPDILCCCNLMMFYDWSECAMSVLAPQNIPSAVVLTLGNKAVL